MRRLAFDESIKFIIKTNKPSIFLDTCVLLDIMRIPFRDIPVSNYYDLDKIIENSDERINVFITDKNLEEFKNNIGNVKIELERHILTIKSDFMKLEIAANYIGKGHDLNFNEIDGYKIPNKIEDKINKLIAKTNLIEINEIAHLDASKRASTKIPPSANGKIGDSLFYCMYLSIWSKLRENQYKNKLVFISSNSKDFGTIKSIFDPIKHELKDNNIDYVNTLSWGLSKMELNA